MCKCLEKIEKKLVEHHNGACVELELKQAIDMKTFEMSPEVPPLYFRYKVGKKWKRSYVTFNFCPFCGKTP